MEKVHIRRIAVTGLVLAALGGVGLYALFSGGEQAEAPRVAAADDPFLPAAPQQPVPEQQAPPAAPAVRVSMLPTSLQLAAEAGTTARGQILVTNLGEGVARIGRISRAGDDAFMLSSECRDLDPQEQCTLVAEFRPRTSGRFQAVAVVTVEGQGALRADITGVGSTPPPAPIVTVAPPPSMTDPTGIVAEDYRWLRRERSSVQIPGLASPETMQSDTGYGADWPADRSSLPVDLSRVLTTDSYIPAVLETSINTQVGGRVTAMVERDVYGRHGSFILIPKGSKLQGGFEAPSRRGVSRLAIIWSRIIRPDGAHIVLQAPAADQMGRGGLVGSVDQRYAERFGVATLISLIDIAATAGAAAAAGNATVTTVGSSSIYSEDAMSRALRESGERASDRLGSISSQLVEESKDFSPQITIAQGTRFSVTPVKDIILESVTPMRIDARSYVEGAGLGVISGGIMSGSGSQAGSGQAPGAGAGSGATSVGPNGRLVRTGGTASQQGTVNPGQPGTTGQAGSAAGAGNAEPPHPLARPAPGTIVGRSNVNIPGRMVPPAGSSSPYVPSYPPSGSGTPSSTTGAKAPYGSGQLPGQAGSNGMVTSPYGLAPAAAAPTSSR